MVHDGNKMLPSGEKDDNRRRDKLESTHQFGVSCQEQHNSWLCLLKVRWQRARFTSCLESTSGIHIHE